jgi:hypothetical protein
MRIPTKLALLVLLVPTGASAQAIDPPFVFGRDYTFEKMVATREVSDAEDKGTIQLAT